MILPQSATRKKKKLTSTSAHEMSQEHSANARSIRSVIKIWEMLQTNLFKVLLQNKKVYEANLNLE